MKDVLQALKAQRLHDPDSWRERVLVWGGALVVGLVVVLFARLSELAGNAFMQLYHWHRWLPLFLTPLGGMAVVYGVRRWFLGAEGSGIPQVIAAISQSEAGGATSRLLSLRIALGKVALGAAAVGVGFSAGREGPSVQVGASLMHALRRFLPKGHGTVPAHLILAGGAAGIAAAFNTPLAGVLFAIEELSRRFEHKTNGVLLTAIVLAGLVSISLQGNYLYFGNFAVSAVDSRIILPVLVCGLVCGVVGGLFARGLLWTLQPWPGSLGRLRTNHPIWFAGACGLLVAVVGILTQGDAFGSGYGITRTMLARPDEVPATFALGKILATMASFYSGIPGGIFAPSLSIGAGIGHDLIPLLGQALTPAGIYALCMAAFLAAVTQAPITAFIIVMEMIDGHEMVLSLIAASLIASLTSKLFCRPLYHALAERQVALAQAAQQMEEAAEAQKKTAP